jgi:hypothetical protein
VGKRDGNWIAVIVAFFTTYEDVNVIFDIGVLAGRFR